MIGIDHRRRIKILGVGKYLPAQKISSDIVDRKLGVEPNWTYRKTGVAVRHYVSHETSSQMGALAAQEALLHAGLSLADVDCIVCANATSEQEIPCTAALLQRELGGENSGIPAFDVNATCLSFVTALDIVSYLLDAGRYNRVLIVSSDISSVALNWEDKESCAIFGDGAGAVVVGRTPPGEGAKVLGAAMQTYSRGASFSELRGGGSKIHPRQYNAQHPGDFLFRMDGRKIYRLSAEILPGFVERFLASLGLSVADLDMVVPHQASLAAMVLTQRNLGIPEGRFMYTIQDHGNTVAASIPMALYEAIKQGKIRRGNKIMLLGVAAGVSMGAMVLEY